MRPMADPVTQTTACEAGVLAVVDQHELERRVQQLLHSAAPPEGRKSPIRTKLEARKYLLKLWLGRPGSTAEAGEPDDNGVIIYPAIGAVVLPNDEARRVFGRNAPRHTFARPRRFSRLAMPAVGSPTYPWHLDKLTLPGSGAGLRIGIADSGFAPGKSGVKLAAFEAFDPVTGAKQGIAAKDFDTSLHGTQVASFACSENEGVAPKAEAVVAAVLTESGGTEGTEIQIAAGLDWLAQQDLDVVNCSFGAPGAEPTWYTAIQNLRLMDVVVVAAIGNRRNDPRFPALFHNVVAVGASDINDNEGFFSAQGTASDSAGNPVVGHKPDVLRPGVNLWCSVQGVTTSGTSFASPMAAAQVAVKFAGQKNLPEDASLIAAQLNNPSAGQAVGPSTGQSGADMPNTASSLQVDGTLAGFRIEDHLGNVLGTHSGGGAIHTFAMNNHGQAGFDVWPGSPGGQADLTMHPVPMGQGLGWTPQHAGVQNALGSHFENSATQQGVPDIGDAAVGGPSVAGGSDRRYLVKALGGQLVVAILYCRADGQGRIYEFGHPSALADNRLPLIGVGRYYPSNDILSLHCIKNDNTKTPQWGSYLKVVP